MTEGGSLETSLGVEKADDSEANGIESSVAIDGHGTKEETLTAAERAWWALMGLGCTWFINDTMFLQLPWWISSQPEGLKLGNRIALSGSVTPVISAAVSLMLRKHYYEHVQRWCMPLMIVFSICAGTIIALGLWEISSNFIYMSMSLASIVGSTTPYLAVPWVMGNGYKPACISPMFLGGSIGSLCASTLALYQRPGDEQGKLFSPSVFFGIITVPVLLALYGYHQIDVRGIGKKASAEASAAPDGEEPGVPPPSDEGMNILDAEPVSTSGCCGALSRSVPLQWDAYLPTNWRIWISEVWALATWMGVIAMCTWTVSRAVMGFASTHTVFLHHECHHLPKLMGPRPACGHDCWEILEDLAGCDRYCHEVEWNVRNPSADELKQRDEECQLACEARNQRDLTDLPCTAGCGETSATDVENMVKLYCQAETACTAAEMTSETHFFAKQQVCRENRGEAWLQLMTAGAQWSYTAGIGLTIAAPSFQLWRISTIWVAAFGTLLVIAMVGDGTFETDFWGYVVVGSALLVRMMDGYIGIMVFRFIAAKHGENEQSITVFFGVVAMVINFFGSIVSTVLVETGIIAD